MGRLVWVDADRDHLGAPLRLPRCLGSAGGQPEFEQRFVTPLSSHTDGGRRPSARYETAERERGKKRESQIDHRPRTLRLQTRAASTHSIKSDAWRPAL